jgi:hypothetical protein
MKLRSVPGNQNTPTSMIRLTRRIKRHLFHALTWQGYVYDIDESCNYALGVLFWASVSFLRRRCAVAQTDNLGTYGTVTDRGVGLQRSTTAAPSAFQSRSILRRLHCLRTRPELDCNQRTFVHQWWRNSWNRFADPDLMNQVVGMRICIHHKQCLYPR